MANTATKNPSIILELIRARSRRFRPLHLTLRPSSAPRRYRLDERVPNLVASGSTARTTRSFSSACTLHVLYEIRSAPGNLSAWRSARV